MRFVIVLINEDDDDDDVSVNIQISRADLRRNFIDNQTEVCVFHYF